MENKIKILIPNEKFKMTVIGRDGANIKAFEEVIAEFFSEIDLKPVAHLLPVAQQPRYDGWSTRQYNAAYVH